MKTIYKYPLLIADDQKIEIPVGHKIINVGLQGRDIVLWAEVDTMNPKTKLEIFIVGTGNELPKKAKCYIGTVSIPFPHGLFVGHVYTNPKTIPERVKEKETSGLPN